MGRRASILVESSGRGRSRELRSRSARPLPSRATARGAARDQRRAHVFFFTRRSDARFPARSVLANPSPVAHLTGPFDTFSQACCKGFAEEVDWLLHRAEPPSDPNLLDPGGRTPLHFAAGWGRADIVEMLLAKGARLETRDRWRKAPIDWALQAQQDEVVERLRIEAVRRGTRGGKGAVAPLATAVEAATGKTQEEIVEELRAFAAKVFRKYRDDDRP